MLMSERLLVWLVVQWRLVRISGDLHANVCMACRILICVIALIFIAICAIRITIISTPFLIIQVGIPVMDILLALILSTQLGPKIVLFLYVTCSLVKPRSHGFIKYSVIVGRWLLVIR